MLDLLERPILGGMRYLEEGSADEDRCRPVARTGVMGRKICRESVVSCDLVGTAREEAELPGLGMRVRAIAEEGREVLDEVEGDEARCLLSSLT